MLIRLIPLDDELDRSYLGRLMRINGQRNEVELLNLIARWAGFPDKTRRQLPAIELLALASGMELQEFVRTHSTLPYRRSITSYLPMVEHGCPKNKDMLFISGIRLARDGVFLCEKCIEKDLLNEGMSYWRRTHQLPGVMVCDIHNETLFYTNDNGHFLFSPLQIIKSAIRISEDLATSARNNDAISRFLKIGRALMSNSAPISHIRSMTALRSKISCMGYRTHCGPSNSPLISDYLVKTYPHVWLNSIIPDLSTKSPGSIFYRIDGILSFTKSPSPVASYLLIAAAIFFSAEDALKSINSKDISFKKMKGQGRDRTRADLQRRYIQAKGKHHEMYSNSLAAPPLMSSHLKTLGLPNLIDEDGSSTLIAMRSFFCDGKSLKESAKLGRVPIDAVEDLIRQAGININLALNEIRQ
ncbi:hypothetical protein GJ699_09335 [Duganella sp. FT80W]|uniref:TniQ domain-containing protein n=1 Tax=Duganella guangzhouensis TaxID=2666084 RepID=A0A6I2KVT1_9BURK|nr:TniQ family protein [Duganella guangzhouensis]MRW90185.1 hypothetical protein [Duganella guangzhouensis]